MSVANEDQMGTAAGGPNGASRHEPSRPSLEGGGKRPFGVVAASAVDGVRTLVRQQIELARIEATEAASIRGMGAGMIVAAGVLVLFAVGFMAAAAAGGLALVLPTWAANLIVAGAFVLASGVLVLVGRRAVRKAPTAERTRETLKEDARWAKRQIAR